MGSSSGPADYRQRYQPPSDGAEVAHTVRSGPALLQQANENSCYDLQL